MREPPFQPSANASPTLVEDLFLTPDFLLKGRLPNKARRLSDLLEEGRQFLAMVDATMVSLATQEVIRTPSLLINSNEVLLAHELIEVAGDEIQRRLAQRRQRSSRIRAFYSGRTPLELTGRTEPLAYEGKGQEARRYFVLEQPEFRGLDLAHPELSVLAGLPYVIVRRERLAYLYDLDRTLG